MRAGHIPEEIGFATKPQLALAMIARAIQAKVPFAWVAADSIYGVGAIELALRRAYKGYVLGVTGQHRCWSWDADLDVSGTAEEIAKRLAETDWLRLSAGAGTKGPRLFDWAYLPLATLPADALDASLDQSLWTRGLLVRRSLSDGALAYFTTWCPAGTPVERLVAVEGRRWVNCDGHENFPDGEVFTGPIETATEGTIRYTFPAVYQGREVHDIVLTFKAGKVVDARASKGEEFLLKMIDQDAGGRTLGEFAIGTNFGITKYTITMRSTPWYIGCASASSRIPATRNSW